MNYSSTHLLCGPGHWRRLTLPFPPSYAALRSPQPRSTGKLRLWSLLFFFVILDGSNAYFSGFHLALIHQIWRENVRLFLCSQLPRLTRLCRSYPLEGWELCDYPLEESLNDDLPDRNSLPKYGNQPDNQRSVGEKGYPTNKVNEWNGSPHGITYCIFM